MGETSEMYKQLYKQLYKHIPTLPVTQWLGVAK